jgi:glycosyltransferase involved in cell wall biosynthesis
MKVKIQQFLFGGELFSWAIVGQNIGRSLLKMGHEVDFVSTDGVQDKFVPDDLKEHIKKVPAGIYDMQVSYTAMQNFPRYLANGRKNRFGIYNYDGTTWPGHFIKFHKFADKVLPSSEFSRQNGIESGIPEEKIDVLPHGINLKEFNVGPYAEAPWAADFFSGYSLRTEKKRKILLNIATPHLRKNLRDTLKVYGKAFTKDDDVCLVVKHNKDDKKSKFVVDFFYEVDRFKKRNKNHAEIEIIGGFVPSLADLYNACDIVFMMSNLECWWLPGTEAFSCNKLVVASNHGGQLHYLNKDNALLIDGDVVRMPKHYQYYTPSVYCKMFKPSIEDGVEKLQRAVKDYDSLVEKFSPEMKKTVEKYTWDSVAEQLIEMAK